MSENSDDSDVEYIGTTQREPTKTERVVEAIIQHDPETAVLHKKAQELGNHIFLGFWAYAQNLPNTLEKAIEAQNRELKEVIETQKRQLKEINAEREELNKQLACKRKQKENLENVDKEVKFLRKLEVEKRQVIEKLGEEKEKKKEEVLKQQELIRKKEEVLLKGQKEEKKMIEDFAIEMAKKKRDFIIEFREAKKFYDENRKGDLILPTGNSNGSSENIFSPEVEKVMSGFDVSSIASTLDHISKDVHSPPTSQVSKSIPVHETVPHNQRFLLLPSNQVDLASVTVPPKVKSEEAFLPLRVKLPPKTRDKTPTSKSVRIAPKVNSEQETKCAKLAQKNKRYKRKKQIKATLPSDKLPPKDELDQTSLSKNKKKFKVEPPLPDDCYNRGKNVKDAPQKSIFKIPKLAQSASAKSKNVEHLPSVLSKVDTSEKCKERNQGYGVQKKKPNAAVGIAKNVEKKCLKNPKAPVERKGYNSKERPTIFNENKETPKTCNENKDEWDFSDCEYQLYLGGGKFGMISYNYKEEEDDFLGDVMNCQMLPVNSSQSSEERSKSNTDVFDRSMPVNSNLSSEELSKYVTVNEKVIYKEVDSPYVPNYSSNTTQNEFFSLPSTSSGNVLNSHSNSRISENGNLTRRSYQRPSSFRRITIKLKTGGELRVKKAVEIALETFLHLGYVDRKEYPYLVKKAVKKIYRSRNTVFDLARIRKLMQRWVMKLYAGKEKVPEIITISS